MEYNKIIFYITGIIGITLLLIGVVNKNNDMLKKYMMWSSLIWAVNFYVNSQITGAVINIINFIRNYLSIGSNNYSKNKRYIIFIIYFILYLFFSLLFSDKYFYLPLIASTLGLLSLFIFFGLTSRIFLFLGSFTWLIYGIVSNNIFEIILETIVLFTFIYSFIKNKFKFDN